MKTALTKNWPAKIASLIAAYAIWYVIHKHINDGDGFRFITEQARGQQLQQQILQREMQQKLLEVQILQQKIDKTMTENAPKEQVAPDKQEMKNSETAVPNP
jgi:ABC-type phosphate transport system auxiliary subunit